MIGDNLIKNSFNTKTVAVNAHTHKRLLMLVAGYIILVIALISKLVDISFFKYSNYIKSPTNLNARGVIYDRSGNILATNIDTFSLYAKASDLHNSKLAMAKLTKIINISNKEAITSRLATRKGFVWIKRHLSPKTRGKILKLGIAGLEFKTEKKRFYPYGNLTSHLVGYTNLDGHGCQGIERTFDQDLTKKQQSLVTSINIHLQGAVSDILKNAMAEFNCKAANAIVMDSKTGEVLAMVSAPSFNANGVINASDKSMFNRNTMGVFEMGSVHKIFTMAIALDSGKVTLNSQYDARKPIKIASKYLVGDYYGKERWLNVKEIFMYSSNIGVMKIIKQIGREAHMSYLQKFGMLESLDFELRNSDSVYPVEWNDMHSLVISYGYTLAVSPLVFLKAANAMINGGCNVSPTLLIKNGKNDNFDQVIKVATSKKVRNLMHLAARYGNAKKAYRYNKDYYIGAKTGTANYDYQGGYRKDKVRTTFFGFIGTDASTPKYSVLVNLEDPKGTKQTYGYTAAGWNAAKVGGQLLQATALITGLAPNLELVAKNSRQKHRNLQQLIAFGDKN